VGLVKQVGYKRWSATGEMYEVGCKRCGARVGVQQVVARVRLPYYLRGLSLGHRGWVHVFISGITWGGCIVYQ